MVHVANVHFPIQGGLWTRGSSRTPGQASGTFDVRPGVRPAAPDRTSGRTVVDGAHVVSGAEKKNHLIEVTLFGRLDQMLRTAVQGGVWRGFAPPAKNRGVYGAAPPKLNPIVRDNIKKNCFFEFFLFFC